MIFAQHCMLETLFGTTDYNRQLAGNLRVNIIF